MGAGKSTVGREVAERLGRAFVDVDRGIERREGRAIPDLFAREGEPSFRAREVEATRCSRSIWITRFGEVLSGKMEWMGSRSVPSIPEALT